MSQFHVITMFVTVELQTISELYIKHMQVHKLHAYKFSHTWLHQFIITTKPATGE